MSQPIVWKCPVCLNDLEAQSEASMFWKQRKHIKEHEATAAVQAVEDASRCCGSTHCEIGKRTLKDSDGLPILTKYDRGFLDIMRISWEDKHVGDS